MTDKKWKLIESRYLLKEPWMTVRADRVELPSGFIIPGYFVLEYPDWVNTLAITKDGQFVMIRQYRHARQVTAYEICAGVMETTDTSPLKAAQRELLEETGYAGGHWELFMQEAPNPGTMTNMTYSFLATGVEKVAEQHLEKSEDIDVYLFSEDEVRRMLENNEFQQALMMAPLWKYFATRAK